MSIYHVSIFAIQYYRFAFFSEYNPVRHVSDHTNNDKKLYQEQEEDKEGMLYRIIPILLSEQNGTIETLRSHIGADENSVKKC